MSWEEDYLMRRVNELTAAMKGAGMLEECANCTTLFAADLDECPNCGHPKGEPQSEAMRVGDRPTPLGGVESTAGANALPPATVHGGADPNAITESEAPEETLDGEPASYEDSNVEQLQAELKRREVFVPSDRRKKNDLVELLRQSDRDSAAKSQG